MVVIRGAPAASTCTCHYNATIRHDNHVKLPSFSETTHIYNEWPTTLTQQQVNNDAILIRSDYRELALAQSARTRRSRGGDACVL